MGGVQVQGGGEIPLRVGHLFCTFCVSGHIAVLQRGTAGNHILLHFTSQFEYLVQNTHACTGLCSTCAPLVTLLLGSMWEHSFGAGSDNCPAHGANGTSRRLSSSLRGAERYALAGGDLAYVSVTTEPRSQAGPCTACRLCPSTTYLTDDAAFVVLPWCAMPCRDRCSHGEAHRQHRCHKAQRLYLPAGGEAPPAR